MASRSDERRFWAKVERGHSAISGCWPWAAYRNPKGYGLFRFGGRTERAHRVSWMLANGEIPGGLHVLHACDRPSCVNPAHLWLGTNAENVADRDAKGRWLAGDRRGVKNPRAKLFPEAVRQIRYLILTGRSQPRIAADFEVSPRTISDVNTGNRWAHVADWAIAPDAGVPHV